MEAVGINTETLPVAEALQVFKEPLTVYTVLEVALTTCMFVKLPEDHV
jgi:hypothetical protein